MLIQKNILPEKCVKRLIHKARADGHDSFKLCGLVFTRIWNGIGFNNTWQVLKKGFPDSYYQLVKE